MMTPTKNKIQDMEADMLSPDNLLMAKSEGVFDSLLVTNKMIDLNDL